jgi:hypothetical protein
MPPRTTGLHRALRGVVGPGEKGGGPGQQPQGGRGAGWREPRAQDGEAGLGPPERRGLGRRVGPRWPRPRELECDGRVTSRLTPLQRRQGQACLRAQGLIVGGAPTVGWGCSGGGGALRCSKHPGYAPNLMAPAARTLPEPTARSEFQNGHVPPKSPEPG